jgi:hypothetical protein
MLTTKRAAEIESKCRDLAVHGPWVDQFDKVLTPEERKEINAYWDTLPGWTSFYHAFRRFQDGTAQQQITQREDLTRKA